MKHFYFLESQLLWGLILVIVPLLIHFLKIKSRRKVVFTRVDLLFKIRQAQRPHSNLKRIILLVLRAMAIVCFVMAAAQPILSNIDQSQYKNSAVLVLLDNSMSMQARQNGIRNLDLAKRDAIASIEYFKSSVPVFLISNDGFYSFDNGNKNVENIVNGIDYSNTKFDPNKLWASAERELLKLNHRQFASYIFSDFLVEKDDFKKTRFFENSKIIQYLNPGDNISLDSVWLSDISYSESTIGIKYRSINYSKLQKSFGEAVYLDGSKIQNIQRILGPQSDSIFNMDIYFGDKNSRSIQISIEDQDIFFDNDLYLSFDFDAHNKVLLLNCDYNSYFQKINGKFGLELDVSNLHSTDLDKISKYSLALVELMPNPTETDLNRLSKLSQANIDLLISPSLKLKLNDFNRYLSALSIGQATGSIDSSFISKINFNHSLVKDILLRPSDNFKPIEIFDHFIIQASGSNYILSDNMSNPVMLQVNNKQSNIYLLSSPWLLQANTLSENQFLQALIYRVINGRGSNLLYSTSVDESKIDFEQLRLQSEDGQNLTIDKNNLRGGGNILKEAGNYLILNSANDNSYLSINYSRNECKMSPSFNNIVNRNEIVSNFAELPQKIELWRIFLSIALVFLLLESAAGLLLKN